MNTPTLSKLLRSLALLPALGALAVAAPAGAATVVWTGDQDANWGTNNAGNTNWAGDVLPVDGDDLLFPAVAANFTNTNNIVGLDLIQLEVGGTGYSIGGNSVSLTAVTGLRDSSASGANTVSLPIVLAANQNFEVVQAGSTLTASGVISQSGGARSVTKTGAGTVRFAQAQDNLFTGPSTVNQGTLVLAHSGGDESSQALVIGDGVGAADSDVVRFSSSNQLDDAAAVTINSSGLFDLSNRSDTTGSLAGSGKLRLGSGGSNQLDVGGSGASTTFSGSIDATADAGDQLIKSGTGTLTLSGASPFPGTLSIDGGTLLVTGSTATGQVNVNNTATLGGTGSVGGTMAVAAGGAVAPGTSAGILSTGGVSFTTGSSFEVELNGTTAGTQYDRLASSGAVDLGSATLDPSLGFAPSSGDAFEVINASGGVTGTFNGLPDLATFVVGGQTFQIDYSATTVILTAIPPGTMIDTIPPDTIIDTGPPALTKDSTPTFTFHATDLGSTFACSIDQGTALFGPCSGAGTHTPALALRDGSYTFRVGATDAAANADLTPATRSFTVDTKSPNTRLTKRPPKTIRSDRRRVRVTFRFVSADPVARVAAGRPAAAVLAHQCKLDRKPFKRCTSPRRLRVRRGKHTFKVRAIDAAGNVDRTPASFRFQVKRRRG